MRRENILILGHDYTTQFVDIFNQYTKLFDKEKYAVTVAFLTGKPNEEVRERTIAEEVLFLNFPKKQIRHFKIKPIKKLLSLTKAKKFKMAICHRYKPSYIMMWVNQFHHIPQMICVMHELRTMSHFSRKLLVAFLHRRNILFAGVSNAVRDDMRQNLWFLPKAQIITLYNMIDIDLVEPQLLSRKEARMALGIPDNVFAFGNLARLVRNKDQATLIEAFKQSESICKSAKLYILGEGDLEESLKAKANEHVIFAGFIATGYRYLKAFDCFVLSSIQEAFGRVLIEAMTARIPIIATRVHGIPEVMGDVGILVTAKECVEFAKALQTIYLMEEDERKAFGEQGYKRASERFSIPQFHQQFWALPQIQHIKQD